MVSSIFKASCCSLDSVFLRIPFAPLGVIHKKVFYELKKHAPNFKGALTNGFLKSLLALKESVSVANDNTLSFKIQ
ncbi:hypothetical protein [Helicobacter pylori]|uniref:hypothetical protein n=1 Tax=Helicobacter pylori TaxID=210 RepID=UPI0012ADBCAF|nr:hypothetical protein [Helicobacter pylori]